MTLLFIQTKEDRYTSLTRSHVWDFGKIFGSIFASTGGTDWQWTFRKPWDKNVKDSVKQIIPSKDRL